MGTETCEVQGFLLLHIVSSRPVWVSLDLVFKKEKRRKKKQKAIVACCLNIEVKRMKLVRGMSGWICCLDIALSLASPVFFQDRDLERLRRKWLNALTKRQEYLDQQLQKLVSKNGRKNKLDIFLPVAVQPRHLINSPLVTS